MRVINLAGDSPEFGVWAARPDETIWAPNWVLYTPSDGNDEDGLHWLRAFPPPHDQFWITGRGRVFTYEHNPAMDLWDPGMLRNQWVVIDSGLYLVTGIEAFRPMISPTNPYGDRSIGILVRSQTDLHR